MGTRSGSAGGIWENLTARRGLESESNHLESFGSEANRRLGSARSMALAAV